MINSANKLSILGSIVCGSFLVMFSSSNMLAAAPIPSVEDRLQRIERIIENPVLLQLSRRLGEQQREIQELQDQIDYLKRDLRKANRVGDNRFKETDDRLSALEKTQEGLENKIQTSFDVTAIHNERDTEAQENVVMDGVGGEDTQKPTVEASATEHSELYLSPIKTHPATNKEQATYQLAFSLIKKGQYDLSIQAFDSFLERYPESELASNASYWMGEAFYIKKDHQAALDAFNLVIKRYPEALKVADAMLRAGDCLDNLKQLKKAKELYTQLIALYPDVPAAKKATKRLEKLQ